MIPIAVIEDSNAVVTLYRSFLEGTEFDLHVFSSSALDTSRLVRSRSFDLIVCPAYPKFQDGTDIIFKIRSAPDLSGVVLILSTTTQKESLADQWQFQDIDNILVKPFTKDRLLQVLYDAYQSSLSSVRETPVALVIDDSNAVRKTLSAFLTSLDFDVKTARDGSQGLELLAEVRPDLILVDIEMPVMDGFEFCSRLSATPQFKNIPVVVISGTMDEAQFHKGFKSGTVDFLQKPVSQDDLSTIVNSVFKQRPSRHARSGILILSQDQNLPTILKKTLNFMNPHINVCTTLDDLETYLNVSIPNIIILDLDPWEDKLNLCQHARNLVKDISTIIIAIAGEQDRDVMFQCFRFGASEFMIKPFSRDEVRARIENHLKIKRLQDELVYKNKILESLAFEDKLTGLMNRRFFDKALKEQIDRAEKNQTPLSFIMMDLDKFKKVNDDHGHEVGDDVLREISQVIMDHLPDHAIACRYGGEEFCMILPELFLEEAFTYGERIRRFCQSLSISRHNIRQTVSAGVSSYPQTSLLTNLVKDADRFLYQAKQSGRNRVMSQLSEIHKPD